jgi:hypothetical protein
MFDSLQQPNSGKVLVVGMAIYKGGGCCCNLMVVDGLAHQHTAYGCPIIADN